MAEIGCNWARIGPSKSSQSLSIAHKWAVEIDLGPSVPDSGFDADSSVLTPTLAFYGLCALICTFFYSIPCSVAPEVAPITVGEVNTRVTELVELHEHDTQDLYTLLEDAQDRDSMDGGGGGLCFPRGLGSLDRIESGDSLGA
ncbi:hypothetical protein Tco_1234784 [Tanacetum coccineum]